MGDNNPAEASKGEVIDDGRENAGMDSLFDEEVFTEEQLSGPDSTSEKKPATEEPQEKVADENSKEKDETKEEKKDEGKPEGTERKADPKDADPGKPPKGFVPIKALQEERQNRQTLQSKLDELEDALETEETKEKSFDPGGSLPENFVVLSKEEYATLNDEDPVAAMEYRLNLQNFKFEQEKVQRSRNKITDDVTAGFNKVRDKIPELFEDDSTIGDDLEAFASASGIDINTFVHLANPATIMVDGDGNRKAVGESAADLVLLLKTVMDNQSSMKKTLEEEIRAEVEAEVMEKFKKKTTEFKSLDDAPGGGESEEGPADLTEDAFRKLTAEEQDRILRGP